MYKVYLYKAALFALGLTMLALGIIIVTQREILMTPLAYFAGAVFAIHGIRNLFAFIAHGGKLGQKRKEAKLITALVNISLAVLIIILPNLSFILAAYLLAAYMLFNGIASIGDFIVARLDRQPGHISDLFAFLFYLVFVVLLLVKGLTTDMFLIISGVYCILFGAEMLSDFFTLLVSQKVKNDLRRHIRISPPVFVSMFMPLSRLRYINDYISLNDEFPEMNTGIRSDGSPPDIEIMIHVSNNGSGRVGHLDLIIDGEVISYGNYDQTSHKLFTAFGDGIMFTAEKDPYLYFSVKHDRQLVFTYGLRLTDEQLEAVRRQVTELKSQAEPWMPPSQKASEEKNAEGQKTSVFHDYGSDLWTWTHCSFYKFTSGKFKNYSVLSTNCVLLTDAILGKAGTDLVCISGVLVPGVYYDYLERLYMTQKSMVISKTIYDRKTMRQLKKERKNENE